MRYADAHADTFFRIALEQLDPLQRDGGLHVNLPRMRDARQILQICSVFTPARYAGKPAEDFARRIIATLDSHLGEHFTPVRSAEDLAGLDGERVGLMPWLEGASPLRGELSLLDEFFELGVRGIGLTHNHANEVADGCGVAEPRRGLSKFGRDLVQRMEELGVAVDCAHLPQPAFNEVMQLIRKPPIITHTGARALVNITRNADDEMLRAVAERGGVIGIDFYPGHLRAGENATADDAAAHITHAINTCGAEGVCLGGDFDGFADTCQDLRHPGDLPNLEKALRKRGIKEEAIEAVFHKNLLRYLRTVLPQQAHANA